MFLNPEQFNAFGEAASVRERILGTRPKRVIRPARLRFASVHALVVCPVAFGNYLACSSLIFLARASCPKGQLERRAEKARGEGADPEGARAPRSRLLIVTRPGRSLFSAYAG